MIGIFTKALYERDMKDIMIPPVIRDGGFLSNQRWLKLPDCLH